MGIKTIIHGFKRLFNRREDELVYRQSGLERLIEAQERDWQTALTEIKNGRKQTHWIWYVFPQLVGLGRSCYSNLYGIRDLNEAEAYLNHPILGRRLRDITSELLKHSDLAASDIFGELDAMKVKSCMTLFDIVSPNDVFARVLDTFYGGKRCEYTLEKVNKYILNNDVII